MPSVPILYATAYLLDYLETSAIQTLYLMEILCQQKLHYYTSIFHLTHSARKTLKTEAVEAQRIPDSDDRGRYCPAIYNRCSPQPKHTSTEYVASWRSFSSKYVVTNILLLFNNILDIVEHYGIL